MLRNTHNWIFSYLEQKLGLLFRSDSSSKKHIMFCVADHYEPLWNNVDFERGENRIIDWIHNYEQAAVDFLDSDGRHPCHTYFFPLEQYNDRFGNLLKNHCGRGFGEVEIHLHHHNDTPDNFVATMEHYKKLLHGNGLLGTDRDGIIRYGFVHGNWALDNSDPEGAWCGLNNELTLLQETGCYADFTFPSAPSPTQTSMINSIYYAVDDPDKPKSHNKGIRVEVGSKPPNNGCCLMIIQGVLSLDWQWRKYGIIPHIENSDISAGHAFMTHRWKVWMDALVSVRGKPEWIFIKVHMHGCVDSTRDMLFREDSFSSIHESVRNLLKSDNIDGFHYVSAREMYNIIKAAEAGLTGNPNEYRNFVILPPPVLQS